MDSNLSDMLGGVLSDPEAMEKLRGMAKAFMGKDSSEYADNGNYPHTEPDGNNSGKPFAETGVSGNDSNRTFSESGMSNNDGSKSYHGFGINGNDGSRASHAEKKKNDQRIALISALYPYLSPERQATANTLIKLLRMMKLTDLSSLLKL